MTNASRIFTTYPLMAVLLAIVISLGVSPVHVIPLQGNALVLVVLLGGTAVCVLMDSSELAVWSVISV